MTELLKKAFEKVGEEFSDSEQDSLARSLLEAIELDEQRWEKSLSDPNSPKMKKPVDQALAYIREGRTEELCKQLTNRLPLSF